MLQIKLKFMINWLKFLNWYLILELKICKYKFPWSFKAYIEEITIDSSIDNKKIKAFQKLLYVYLTNQFVCNSQIRL